MSLVVFDGELFGWIVCWLFTLHNIGILSAVDVYCAEMNGRSTSPRAIQHVFGHVRKESEEGRTTCSGEY